MPENGYIHEQLYTLYIQTELTEHTIILAYTCRANRLY